MEKAKVDFDGLMYQLFLIRSLNETIGELINDIHDKQQLEDKGYEFERLFDNFLNLGFILGDETRRLEDSMNIMQQEEFKHNGARA